MINNKGKPFVVMGRYSGSDTNYQDVAVWKIGQVWELGHGRLHRIRLESSNYTITNFRLTVLGNVLFRDLQLIGDLTLTFADNELPRGEKIKVETKSSTGAAIAVTAAITGVEY